MKRILLLTCFISLSSPMLSQEREIDSLKQVLTHSKNDRDRLENLKLVCKAYSNSKPLEQSQPFYDELITLAQKQKDQDALVYAYQLLIREYEKKRDSSSAFEYFEKSNKINKEKGNKLGLAKDYVALAGVYNKYQQYDRAEEEYSKAMKICLKNEFDYIGKVYLNLAIVNQNQNEYDISTDYAIKAQKVGEETNNLELLSDAIGVIGGNYLYGGDLDKAEKMYNKALKITEGKTFYRTQFNNYRGLALSYSRAGKFDEALQVYQKALSMLESYGDKLYILDVLMGIGTTYLRMDNYTKANEYYERAKRIAIDLDTRPGLNVIRINQTLIKVNQKKYDEAEKLILNTLNDTIDKVALPETSERSGYILLTMIYEGKKDFENALLYHKKFSDLALKIQKENQLKEVAELETKYQTEKKEKENLDLKQQNAQQALLAEKERTQKYALAGGMALSLAALGVFLLVFRKNQRQKREIEKQKAKVEHLQRELHHRLKNNLAFIDFFITLAKGRFPDPQYRQKLDELQNRIKSMFEVHRQLYQKDDLTTVNAKAYIATLVENVKKAYDRPNIHIEEKVTETDLRADTSFPIGLIINEFVTNSYKYAFPNGEKGTISINLEETPAAYQLQLADDGQGLPEDLDLENLNSFGMETMKLLTEEYKGTFHLNGTNGLRMDITLPK